MNQYEEIRQSYKPKKINLLFIAESPPKGGTFFYLRNSNLYFAIKQGFDIVFGNQDNKDFLNFFKEQGCYLDDLCLKPVNGLPFTTRQEERITGINPLAERIKEIEPKVIIILMKEIEGEIRTAIENSKVNTIEFTLVTSFPAHSENNRMNCIKGIIEVLKESIKRGIIITQHSLHIDKDDSDLNHFYA